MSQTSILAWVAISFSRGSFQTRDRTQVFCLAGRYFTVELSGKASHRSTRYQSLASNCDLVFFFPFFFFICSEFCHTLEWNSHGFTCVPHPNPPSHLPLPPLPLGFPSAPGPSACLMHPTWAGDLICFISDSRPWTSTNLPAYVLYWKLPINQRSNISLCHALRLCHWLVGNPG